jgi:hypothetical protein
MNSLCIVFLAVFICGCSHSLSVDPTTGGARSLQPTSVAGYQDKKLPNPKKDIQTIEDAESYIESRGISLLDKQEHQDVTIGKRVFKYKYEGVNVILIEFDTRQEMNEWADMADASPIRGTKVLRKDKVAIQIWRGPDGPREDLIRALGDTKD